MHVIIHAKATGTVAEANSMTPVAAITLEATWHSSAFAWHAGSTRE